MAEIRIPDMQQAIEANSSVSILNNLLRAGMRIRHDCGGKALCGTCRIRVVSGGENLSPRGEREISRLDAVGAAQNERLACQSFCRKSVTVKIREEKAPSGPEDKPSY